MNITKDVQFVKDGEDHKGDVNKHEDDAILLRHLPPIDVRDKDEQENRCKQR